jgi:hypothetical protein
MRVVQPSRRGWKAAVTTIFISKFAPGGQEMPQRHFMQDESKANALMRI